MYYHNSNAQTYHILYKFRFQNGAITTRKIRCGAHKHFAIVRYKTCYIRFGIKGAFSHTIVITGDC